MLMAPSCYWTIPPRRGGNRNRTGAWAVGFAALTCLADESPAKLVEQYAEPSG